MAVKVRQRNRAWWIFIDHQGSRKAKRVGVGEAGRKAAKLAAQQIQARPALGHAAFTSQKSGVTIEAYAQTFLQRIEHTRKHTTLADYQKILARDILRTEQQIEAAARGWAEIPAWVFCNEVGGLLHPHNLRDRIFYGLLTKAKLRKVRFHDLRHTFASLLLQQGESLVYVKEQMGHSSIQVTVDLYGHLIPGGNKQAVDRLDTPAEPSHFEAHSATQPQPAAYVQPVTSPDRVNYPVVAARKVGVSDGFRTS